MVKKIDTSKDEELERLRAQNAEYQARLDRMNNNTDVGRTFFQEIEKIRKVGKVTTGGIQYKDTADHVNVSLWRRDGKRIGPLHPANAEVTLKRFWDEGITLTVDKPTEAQIEAFKQTDEYKTWFAKTEKQRIQNEKSLKGNAIEKLTEAIAAQLGVPAGKLNQIKSPDEMAVR